MSDLRKLIKLDLSNVPASQHKTVKDEVGNYLVNQVLRDIERGSSPVDNEGQFKTLNKDYADKEKQGRRTPNLELEGELKEAIQYRRTKDGIEFGNFKKSQEGKADGHNQHSSKAKAWAKKRNFPKRRYIPDNKQKFRQDIEREIDSIVSEFEVTPEENVNDVGFGDNQTETGNRVQTDVVDIFSDDVIDAEIRRQVDEV